MKSLPFIIAFFAAPFIATSQTYTFSTGLTKSAGNDVTNNLSTGVSGEQILVGSTSPNAGIRYKATSGIGSTGADHIFTVGTNGGLEAMRITNGGNVGIGTSPNANASLDVASTSKYALLPRMNTAQMNAIPSPMAGALVFNNDSASYMQHTGLVWEKLGGTKVGSVTSWLLNGNDISAAPTSYIGTTSNNPFAIRTNNVQRMLVDWNGYIYMYSPAFVKSTMVFQNSSSLGGRIEAAPSGDGLRFKSSNDTQIWGTILGGGSWGIGTTTPNANALLDVTSTSKYALLPRMNTAQMNAIPTPTAGALLFNSDSSSYMQYTGTAWQKLAGVTNGAAGGTTSGGVTSWLLNGNDITAAPTSYIGTTSNNPFAIRTNNVQRMLVDGNGYIYMHSPAFVKSTMVFQNSSSLGGRIEAAPSGDGLRFKSSNDTQIWGTILGGGNWGIGTTSPNADALLDVASTSKYALLPRMTTAQMNAIATPVAGALLYNNDLKTYNWYNGSAWQEMGGSGGGSASQWISAGSNIFFSSGKVGIGNVDFASTQEYSLAVNGTVLSKKIKVMPQLLATWPDYVFGANYNLAPLDNVEAFIKENNHLPDVPSAEEVRKDGIDIGENQAILLKKIEELTLYIIELEKKVKDINAWKTKLETLEKNTANQ